MKKTPYFKKHPYSNIMIMTWQHSQVTYVSTGFIFLNCSHKKCHITKTVVFDRVSWITYYVHVNAYIIIPFKQMISSSSFVLNIRVFLKKQISTPPTFEVP